MNYFLELTLAIISAIFVLFTAMIDSQAAVIVAGVAVLCYLAYKMFFAKTVEDSIRKSKPVVKVSKSAKPRKISKKKARK